MRLTLSIWRQRDAQSEGKFVDYALDDVSEHSSLLDVLDLLNERLIEKGEEPVAFDHDCREGICGSCGCMVDGVPHGPQPNTTVCQLHMRHYPDGSKIKLEPFRSEGFPLVRDLYVDRSSLDRIVQAGGYISVRTGAAPDANVVPVPKVDADRAFDLAACIGCGACAAACPNASATLFTAAKIGHLASLPQGQPERRRRVMDMVMAHDHAGFGACSNHGECAAVCPKGIDLGAIAQMNRDFRDALLKGE